MGWLGNLIGGLFKVILSPLIDFIMSLLYGVLIRGPLTILNSLDKSFQYVSGSSVDKMLFSTSLSDGKPQLNFFASDSPLKMFFLIIVGITGALIVVFSSLMIIHTLTGKRKDTPIGRTVKIFGSFTGIFAIPTGFLMALSLAGGVMSAISGQHIDMSTSNVATYSKKTIDLINRVEGSPGNMGMALNSNNDPGISGMLDDQAKPKTYSLNDIYSNFQNVSDWKTSDSVKQIASQVEDDYRTLKNDVVDYDSTSNGLVINQSLENNLSSVKDIINKLQPNIKDETMSDEVKVLQDNLQNILNAYGKWISDSNILLSYGGVDLTKAPNIAVNNYKIYFNEITILSNNQNNAITTLNDLATNVGYLISGDTTGPDGSLISLRQHLSDLKENSLVVSFYQLATGNHDANWDRSIGDFQGGGFMLLVGCLLICAACVIMILATLSAVTRIFDLGLLFIFSPAVVAASAFDEGQRFKNWSNLVIAKLIGIFGIVICLRLFGMLFTGFKSVLDSAHAFDGNTGFMVKCTLEGMFGLGGMLSAYKGAQTLSSMVGAGYGIAEGLNASQAWRAVRGTTGFASGASKFMGGGIIGAIGMRALSPANGGGSEGGGSPNMRTATRNPLKNISANWQNRAQKATNAATNISFGRIGTDRSKNERLGKIQERKFNKVKQNQENIVQKAEGQAYKKYWNDKKGKGR